MSREATLLKNTIIFAIGNFSSKFLGFLILPLYTAYLNSSEYGYYDLIVSTASLLLPIISFQIYDGLYRNLLEVEELEEKKKNISATIYIIVRNLVIFNVLYLLVDILLPFKNSSLILLFINVFIIYTAYLQIARGFKQNAVFSIAGIINTVLVVLFSLYFIILLNLKVSGLLLSMILSYFICIVYLEVKLKVIRYIRFSKGDKKVGSLLIAYSLPLIPNTISWWIMNVSDRYLLTHFAGVEANGLYAIANKFPAILLAINSVFYLSWQESSITEYEAKDRNEFYTKMFNNLVVFQFSFVLVLIAFTKPMMQLLVNAEFYAAWKYVPALYIGAVFFAFSSFYGTGFLSTKKTKGAFYSSVFGSIANILLNIILIPFIGIQGAAISTMLAFIIMWIIRMKQTKTFFQITIKKIPFLILVSLILLEIIGYYLDYLVLDYILMIASLISFLLLNKNLIVGVLGKTSRKWIKRQRVS
ncbi:oligosaccharide flippase family protein [Niallia sp. 01092]|uniref:oligosaccharide flippase family protein n=1 Tax=unclassified Niallia TaxID=2837522 RepID=UPI003FD2711F